MNLDPQGVPLMNVDPFGVPLPVPGPAAVRPVDLSREDCEARLMSPGVGEGVYYLRNSKCVPVPMPVPVPVPVGS